jgi:hypothetical protein
MVTSTCLAYPDLILAKAFNRAEPPWYGPVCLVVWEGKPARATLSRCVPGMHTIWEGESPSRNLMEVKRREAQGRHREVGSEGSVDQRYEPTNRNWIRRRQGGTS